MSHQLYLVKQHPEKHIHIGTNDKSLRGTYFSSVNPFIQGKWKCIIDGNTGKPKIIVVHHASKILRLVFVPAPTPAELDEQIILECDNDMFTYKIEYGGMTDSGKIITKQDDTMKKLKTKSTYQLVANLKKK